MVLLRVFLGNLVYFGFAFTGVDRCCLLMLLYLWLFVVWDLWF